MKISDKVKRIFRLDIVDPVDGTTRIDQSPELEELAGAIKTEYERRREERRPFELQWRLNQNFLAGNQYCDIVTQTGEVTDIPAFDDQSLRNVYNQIAPIVETRLSKLSRVKPGLLVRPATSDVSDITTAKASTKLLKNVYASIDMPYLQMQAAGWAEICGCVFYKNVWNPKAGPIIGYAGGKPVYEGDLGVSVIPAYEIFPYSCYQNSIDEQDSIIHARAYTIQEIFNRWGIIVEGKELDVFSIENSGILPGGNDYNPSMSQVHGQRLPDSEVVIEYYERPGIEFPRGRFVILVGDIVVHIGELPFQTGKYHRPGYPFVKQQCIDRPGVFWGTSIIERLIPLQRDYNAVKNKISEHIARMAVGNIVAEEGSLVDETLLDTGIEPGSVIEYHRDSSAPEWMKVQEVPDSMFTKIAEMQKEFIDISGVSEMAKNSSTPNAISSGVALEILKEQDDTRLAITAENIRMAIRNCGIQWLRIFRQFVVGLRISRVVGEDDDISSMMWSKSDITSDDVIVDTDNEMINTPAQRKQLALQLIQTGMFADPDTKQMTRETRAKLMEVFELGNWESAVDMDELHQARARREQAELLENKVPRITEYDSHTIHVREHIRFVLSAEYREFTARRPEMGVGLLMHIEAHKKLAAAQAARLSGAAGMASQGEPMASALNRDVINTSTNEKGSIKKG